MGDRQSTLWVHRGDTHQLTFEGFAYSPQFSADGKRLFYLQRTSQNRRFVSGELWSADLATGKRERLLSDELMDSYDISRDGSTAVFVRVDANGQSSVWEATLDGSAAPKQLSALQAIRVLYGPSDDVYFVGGEAPTLYVYRVARMGDTPRKIVPAAANYLYAVSPDGKWLAAWIGLSVAFYPVDGGDPKMLCAQCGTAGEEQRGVTPALVRWSSDGRTLYLHGVGARATLRRRAPAWRHGAAAARQGILHDRGSGQGPRRQAHRGSARVSERRSRGLRVPESVEPPQHLSRVAAVGRTVNADRPPSVPRVDARGAGAASATRLRVVARCAGARAAVRARDEGRRGPLRHAGESCTADLQCLSNGGVLAGRDAVLLIEGHMQPAGATFELELARLVSNRPIRGAVNTHFHPDHAFGDSAYAAARVPIIAQDTAPALISPSTRP